MSLTLTVPTTAEVGAMDIATAIMGNQLSFLEIMALTIVDAHDRRRIFYQLEANFSGTPEECGLADHFEALAKCIRRLADQATPLSKDH